MDSKSNWLLTAFCVLLILSGTSCSKNNNPQKIYKNDSHYYLGLKALKNGKNRDAERQFSIAEKKGTSLVSRRSAEELAKTGNITERLKNCEKLYSKYSDQDSLLVYLKELKGAEEFGRIIYITDTISKDEMWNSCISIRLDALFQRNDDRFENELFDWFSTRQISQEHFNFYSSHLEYFGFSDENDLLVPEWSKSSLKKLVDLRLAVFRKDYKKAYSIFKSENQNFPLIPQVYSDFGKACLYGSSDYVKDAVFFKNKSGETGDKELKYYLEFYAGRLYSKAGNYFTGGKNAFLKAMENASSDKKYDDALWYLLDLNLRTSTDKGVECVKEYSRLWHNPEYFDDLLNLLPPLLLSEGKWNAFYDLYHTLDGYASNEAVAKFAYIYGRLVEEKITVPVISEITGTDAEAAFTRALTSGSSVYYRVMAASRLGLGGENEEEVLSNIEVTASPDEINSDAERLLSGYAAFGLPEKIFPEYMRLYSDGIYISSDCAFKLSQFLKECGKSKSVYYPQSLRIASRGIAKSTRPVSKEDLMLFFPRDYEEEVSENALKNGIPEEILYAMIRSESFFDEQVSSSQGAAGLTQLMRDTASEIAGKLKMPDYDIRKSGDNIKLGSYYLGELYGRLNSQWLPSFFSYNAGIKRVRIWLKDSKISFKSSKPIPMDIFLEMLPYEETREYGRKLVSASAMYGWLYYGKDVSTVTAELMK